jgi:hypothetical protein
MPRSEKQEKNDGRSGRGAREPGNPTGKRKQGGRKATKKSTLTRPGKTGAKRAGSESGGTKKKGRGGGAGKNKGAGKR